MSFERDTCARPAFGVLLAFFFLTSYLGGVTIMKMHPDGVAVSGCPFMPGMASWCHMSSSEHIAAWQDMFTALPNQIGISALLLLLLSLACGAMLVRAHRIHARQKPLAISPACLYCDRRVPISRALQEAFANGILHPKIF